MKIRGYAAIIFAGFVAACGLIAAGLLINRAHAQTGVFAGGQKFVVISTASTNAQVIALPGPHQLLEITLNNPTTTAMSLKLYDSATAPTCSATPSGLYEVAGATLPAVGQLSVVMEQVGSSFTNGIGICIITPASPPTLADTAVAVAGLIANFTIK